MLLPLPLPEHFCSDFTDQLPHLVFFAASAPVAVQQLWLGEQAVTQVAFPPLTSHVAAAGQVFFVTQGSHTKLVVDELQ